MAGEIAKEVFSRSAELYNLRYTSFIGDGDTNNFKNVFVSKPYGDVTVQKLQCVGPAQKRMGKRLRGLKKNAKGTTLADGKSIGGRGRSTDMEINKIQAYYGIAIRGKTNNMEINKIQAHQRKYNQSCWDAVCCLGIFVFVFHKLSIDEKPWHNCCL